MTSRHLLFALTLALVAEGAAAQALVPPTPEVVEAGSRRHPQPVRAGDIVGRKVLEPLEDQPVLGSVAGLVRRPDGGVSAVVKLSGWLGLGFAGRSVAVPVEGLALLGEHVAAMGYKPQDIRALPTFGPGSAPDVGANETLRVGVVRPFH